jgi:multidrug resistance efflux pump
MDQNRISAPPQMDVLELIERLRLLNGQQPGERDYALYTELIRQICKAKSALIVSISPEPTIRATASPSAAWTVENFQQEYGELLRRASNNGFSHTRFRTRDGIELLVLSIKMAAEDKLFLLVEMPVQDISKINETILRCMLAVNTSAIPNGIHQMDHISPDILKWMTDVLKQKNFGSAVLTLVNEAVSSLSADFAALIWIANAKPEIAAISHIDKFDRNNKQVALLEDIAAEVLVQNEALNWQAGHPPAEKVENVRLLCENNGHAGATAFPMRNSSGDISAVLIVAYNSIRTENADSFSVPIALDMMQPRLGDQYISSLNTLTRAKHSSENFLANMLGFEHLWFKVAGLTAFVLLLASLIIYWPYRVEAGATFQTNSTRILSAPVDGRIENVYATAGDTVKSGFVIAALDTHDLKLQKMEMQDQIARYSTEASKSRAEGDLANAEISDARRKEAVSKEDEIDYYIENASLKAPFDGIVVEGEKRELLGAPVKKGEQLFKLAKIENIYVTLLIPESDIKEISPDATGTLALLSQPGKPISFRINSIIPVSQTNGQEGAKFEAIASIDGAPEDWWRPGMTGVAKIDAGNRQIFWILTHKIADLLLLKILY